MIKTLNELKKIAKAKFSDKSKLGDWYKSRLEICQGCPFNSVNKENKTAKENLMVAANFGKPTCLACSCEIAAKASVKSEKCGLYKIGLEPLWEEIGEEVTTVSDLNIQNSNPEKATVYFDKTENKLKIDYGVVPYGFDSKINLTIESSIGEITKISAAAGCGCTTTSSVAEEGLGKVGIAYDTKRTGRAEKVVHITYNVGQLKRNLIVKLSIEVKK